MSNILNVVKAEKILTSSAPSWFTLALDTPGLQLISLIGKWHVYRN